MIKEKEIIVNISYRNITHYRELGYNVDLHKPLLIVPRNLPPVSHQKVTAICDICGVEKEIAYHKYLENEKRCGYYGCKKCSNLKREITSLDRYGKTNYAKTDECKEKISKNNIKKYGVKTTLLDKDTKIKIDKTILDKYGTESHLSNIEIREKIKNTMLKNYDVEYPIQNKEIKNRIKKTCFQNYGVEYPIQNKDIKVKTDNTNLKRYGDISPIKSDIIKNKLAENFKNKYSNINIINVENKYLFIKCEKCDRFYKISKTLFNHKLSQNVILCPMCNPPSNSTKEINILEFILTFYKNNILSNDKKILDPLELDIYIPELKIAFEYNGIFWHNELNKDDNYHLNKTELCEKQGIQLIHIWEDDWLYKQDIVKSMILNKLGKTPNKIYARKTEVKEIIDNKIVREFLDKNHLQGFVGSKIKLGLFYGDELVSLMTFGKRRVAMGKKKTNENEYELLRFCNKLNTNVIGGASKLFKYFINNYKPKEITTYADRSHSNGHLYETLGFKFVCKTRPNYYYVISRNRCHRFNFRKDVLVKQGFDINKTEHEIMLERKIFRIYDSGNLKFLYKPFSKSCL
jgi:Zn finger protein HypA/HybF involved in hydrogenase expression